MSSFVGFPSTSKSIADKPQKRNNKPIDSKKHISSELKNKVDLPGFIYTKPLSFTDVNQSLSESINDKMIMARKQETLPNPYSNKFNMPGKSSSATMSSQINKDLKMQEFTRQMAYENIKSTNKMSPIPQMNQPLKKTAVSNKIPDRQNMISPNYNPIPVPTQFRYLTLIVLYNLIPL